MRVCSEGSEGNEGRVGEQRGREYEKARGEEEGRKRREGRGEVEERREWKEPRSTMMDKKLKWSSLKGARNGRKRKREVIQMG